MYMLYTEYARLAQRVTQGWKCSWNSLKQEPQTLLKRRLSLHWPGIGTGSPAWQVRILPLNHQRSTAFAANRAFTGNRVCEATVKSR